MSITNQNLGSGTWTYRSLLNDPNIATDFDALEFGRGTLIITTHTNGALDGTIGGPGWSLTLKGSVQHGSPATLWFRGTGVVSGSLWIYDYLCYIVPTIPEGIDQVPALAGSVTRAIPHPDGQGGTSPAGVVASFYAVLQPSIIQ
jgi:hypothetical protein